MAPAITNGTMYSHNSGRGTKGVAILRPAWWTSSEHTVAPIRRLVGLNPVRPNIACGNSVLGSTGMNTISRKTPTL
jgi:hypothetical protein